MVFLNKMNDFEVFVGWIWIACVMLVYSHVHRARPIINITAYLSTSMPNLEVNATNCKYKNKGAIWWVHGLIWESHGCHMGVTWEAHWYHMCFYVYHMGFSWVSHGLLCVSHGLLMGITWASMCITWASHGYHMGFYVNTTNCKYKSKGAIWWVHGLAMSSNRTTMWNKEQGSYWFIMQIEWQINSCLAVYSVK